MIEHDRRPIVPSSYGEVIKSLERVVTPHVEYEVIDEWEGGYEERGTTAFDGTIRAFYLPTELTNELGLGGLVRCRVIGSVEEGMGVAFIVKSLNPFKRKVQGFYLQPTTHEEDGPELYDKARGYEVWQAPARWPNRNGVYWGKELLDDANAHLADPLTTEALIQTIQKHAQFKS